MISSKPKLIELTDIEELKKTINVSVPDADGTLTELNELKAEGKQILKETEQMVLELLESAQAEAGNIIFNAQEEADVIRTEVYEEAKTLRQEAIENGYEEGLRLINVEIEADRQHAIEQSELIIEEARKKKLGIIKSAEPDIVRLIMAIAKKIIATELTINTLSIVNVVREAIGHLDNPENVKVNVNPLELENLLASMDNESLADIGSKDISVDIKGDNRINVGGAFIDSDNGSVDARIEKKIENIEKGLMEVSGDE